MPQPATSTGCLHGLACCGEGAATATSTGGHHDYRYDDDYYYYYHYYYDSYVGMITLF